ncbi:MAG: AhpC/TSA family protein [Bacteroidota bacterium]|nr:AhpC/TSA family protein [Bacteroidota bacterium]
MKKLLWLLACVPLVVWGQKEKKSHESPAREFVLSGYVKGFPNGTPVSFLNQQTGQPEQQATIENDHFVIKGSMEEPNFKILIFNNRPPAVVLFLDNSHVVIRGQKDSLQDLSIKGSPSQDQFMEYAKATQPYAQFFQQGATIDPQSASAVEKISEDFVKKHLHSYVAPLALIRIIQSTDDILKVEALFKEVSAPVRASTMGQYVDQQIQLGKINPVGSVIKNFTQTDTAGKPLSITSLRGKYVLVDFWASWCRPCRMENPNVVAAYRKFHEKNFTILSVSLDQAKPAWISAIKMDSLTWNHVSDLKGWGNSVATLFRITSIPQNILIDPNGKIIAKNLRGPMLESELASVLK